MASDPRPTIVAALGDISQDEGTAAQFRECYHPAWGSFQDITRPAMGNHDDVADGGKSYFNYFSDLDLNEPKGWYAYQHGDWQVFVLNTECGGVGGCEKGDPQYEWLKQQLSTVTTDNILAYWHKPRFAIGKHGNFSTIADAYALLDQAGADVILAGHDDGFQRWAPLRADGTRDASAPRSFVVGTGGGSLRSITTSSPPKTLEYYQDDHYGVMRLELQSCSYRWEFINVDGKLLDHGSGGPTC
jgi:acid phosphatase type 7